MSGIQRWLRARGGSCPKLDVKAQGGGERAVVAKGALKAGEEVFSVPRAAWLTAGGLQEHVAGRAALAWAGPSKGSCGAGQLPAEHLEIFLLALLLLLERKVGSSSAWADYVASLPWNDIDHLPLTWSLAELEERLSGAAPQRGIEAKLRELSTAIASLSSFCASSGKEAFSELASAVKDEEALVRAIAVVHSRAMGVPSKDAKGRPWSLLLLPFADMFNHSSDPEVEWDVEASSGSARVFGRVVRDVTAGAELRFRYRGAASAQAFFATYGFIEDIADISVSELHPFWETPSSNAAAAAAVASGGGGGGGGSCDELAVRLSSGRSIRRLLSRLRVVVATPEERKRLDPKASPADAARLPISARCERAALEQLRTHLAARARLGQEREAAAEKNDSAGGGDVMRAATKALRTADAAGWVRMARLAASVLGEIEAQAAAVEATGQGQLLGPERLAVLVHKATREAVFGPSRWGKVTTEFFDKEGMVLRDCGGTKGRGYFATQPLEPGRLLLVEEPFVFDAADDDFVGVAAAHVLGVAASGLVELRVGPDDEEDREEDARRAGRWLRGVEGISASKAAEAFAAANNNGFQTTMPGAPEEQPMLLFRRLCMFNHACAPNCAAYRDGSTGTTRVLLIRPVRAGDELTIHYSDELILLPTHLRQRFIKGRFGFECHCLRCEGIDPTGRTLEAALARDRGSEGEVAQLHMMVAVLQQSRSGPIGFGFREFDDWPAALARAEMVLPRLAEFGAETFWARYHVRQLKCLALEAMERDSAAFLTLAEHAAAAWKLLPPCCDALKDLDARLGAVAARLPAALRPRFEEKAAQLHGPGLLGLAKDMETLRGWLRKAGAEEAEDEAGRAAAAAEPGAGEECRPPAQDKASFQPPPRASQGAAEAAAAEDVGGGKENGAGGAGAAGGAAGRGGAAGSGKKKGKKKGK